MWEVWGYNDNYEFQIKGDCTIGWTIRQVHKETGIIVKRAHLNTRSAARDCLDYWATAF